MTIFALPCIQIRFVHDGRKQSKRTHLVLQDVDISPDCTLQYLRKFILVCDFTTILAPFILFYFE